MTGREGRLFIKTNAGVPAGFPLWDVRRVKVFGMEYKMGLSNNKKYPFENRTFDFNLQ